MKINKGDLVLATDGENTSTCVVLTARYSYEFEQADSFYYSYCLETGLYGILYDREILSVVSKNFAPNFEFDSQIFDTKYDFYQALCDSFSYWPYFWPSATKYDIEDESTEELSSDETETNDPEDNS